MHQSNLCARQTNLCWEVHCSRLFLNQDFCFQWRPVMFIPSQQIVLHGHHNQHVDVLIKGILLCLAVEIYCFNGKTASFFFFWANVLVFGLKGWWPPLLKHSYDPWRPPVSFSTGTTGTSALQTISFTSVKKNNTIKNEKTHNDESQKQPTWKYWNHIIKLSVILTAAGGQTRKALSSSSKVMIPPPPCGETCVHQWADKWYELWSLC